MKRGRGVARVVLALGAAVLLLAPLGVGRIYSAYYLNLLTWVLIFGLFAAALDLALGYGGLVSFGHAAFFGAYVMIVLAMITYALPGLTGREETTLERPLGLWAFWLMVGANVLLILLALFVHRQEKLLPV